MLPERNIGDGRGRCRGESEPAREPMARRSCKLGAVDLWSEPIAVAVIVFRSRSASAAAGGFIFLEAMIYAASVALTSDRALRGLRAVGGDSDVDRWGAPISERAHSSSADCS
jgi:hypothetical protein